MRPGAAKGNAGSFALHRKKTKFSLKTKKNKQKQNTNARSKSTKRIPIWYSPSAMHLKIWFWVFSSVFFLPHQKQNRFHFFRVFFCFFFFVRLPRGRRWPSTIGRCAGPDENAIKKQMSPGLPIEEKSKRSPQKKWRRTRQVYRVCRVFHFSFPPSDQPPQSTLTFTNFYLVLLGFTGFHLVSLGFTGFYRVLPSSK